MPRLLPVFLPSIALLSLIALPAQADTLIVLNKAEASASLLNPITGKELARLKTGVGPHEVAVSPDGRHALVGNYGSKEPGHSLTLIDISAAKVLRTISLLPFQRPHGIQWLPDDRVLVTSETHKALLQVNVRTGAVTPITTGQQTSHMVATTPDGSRAFVANIGSGNVSVIDLALRRVLATVATGKGAEGIAVTPDGREVWVTNRDSDTISILDARQPKVLASVASGKFPIRVQISPDGRHALVSNAKSAELAVFDVATRKELRRIRFADAAATDRNGRMFDASFASGSVPIGILIAPEGPLAYVAHANADGVSVVDYVQGKVVNRFKTGKEPDGLGWSMLTVSAPTP